MSRLVRLYPKAWRDRYGAEFQSLLEDRPPTIGDVVDTVRGAFDAHLHPHLAGSDLEPSPWTHRIPGLLALLAGAMWAGNVLFLVFWADRNEDWGSLIGASTLVMFVSLPGDYMAAHGRRIAVAFGVVGACLVGASMAPWPVLGLFAVVGYLVALGGMLTMAAIRAGIGSVSRWILLALAVGLPVAIATPLALGTVGLDDSRWQFLAILLPYGLAWVGVGVRMTIRGAPTIVDQPLNAIVSEVRAA